ncbi:MAG: metallophosphoesterase [Kiritimatiellae bacterium]|nr:metallophosphoesterase [Kiritimatiellia bacterium]
MKKNVVWFAAALCAAGAANAEETLWTKYRHWEVVPVLTEDPDAGTNVRQQMDFTKPWHGPWLINPSTTGMTVGMVTRIRVGAAIEWREKGTEAWTRRWNAKCGTIDYSEDVHLFHLRDLKPGTVYEYRFVTAMSGLETAYTGIVVGRETYSFTTMDPKRDRYRVWATADFHGGARLNLDPMYERTEAEKADFYLLLGDNVEDRFASDAMFYVTYGYMDDICRLWGKRKPTVFVRGNHDASGQHIGQWGRFQGHPSGCNYFSFTQGPVLWVVLDTNKEWQNSPAGKEQLAAYLKEQLEWLRGLKKTDAWKRATYRVVCNHFGWPADAAESPNLGPEIAAELNDATPEGRIHLFLAGHTHVYTRHDPGAAALKAFPAGRPNKKGVLPPPYASKEDLTQFKYCQVIGRQCETMTLDVSPEKIVVRSRDWRKPGLPDYDAFELFPDGSVKDLK